MNLIQIKLRCYRMKETYDSNCKDIERLLTLKSCDRLTEEENQTIEKHLTSCEHCRSYQNNLLNIQYSMKVDADVKLIPNPGIRQNIIQRMKVVKHEESGLFQQGWRYMKNVFEYRIPVYQALLGVAGILLIFIAINQPSVFFDWKPSERQALIEKEIVVSDQVYVIKNLDMIKQQKIGRNVREDSVLVRYIVPAM